MAVTTTLSGVPSNRVFPTSGSNFGALWIVTGNELDLNKGFFQDDEQGAYAGMAIRSSGTWWIQFTEDLEALTDITGPRTDLQVEVTHAVAGALEGSLVAYQTRADRGGGNAQANISPGDGFAVMRTWCQQVADATDRAVDIKFTSESGTSLAASRLMLGPDDEINRVFLGADEIVRAYLGGERVFGPAPTIAVAPGVPTGLRLTPGNGQITAAWTEPAVGTAPITYRLRHRVGSGDWTEIMVSGTSRTVTGLANGTAHEFQVRAENSAGNSAYSASVSATPTVPNAPPTGVSVARTSSGSLWKITFTFTAPAAATGFRAQYFFNGNWVTANESNAQSGVQVPGWSLAGSITRFRIKAQYASPVADSAWVEASV